MWQLSKKSITLVIFQTFGEAEGFSMYINDSGNNMDVSANEIENLVSH